LCLTVESTAVVEAKDVKQMKRSSNNDKVYIEIMVKPLYGQNIKYIFNIFYKKFYFYLLKLIYIFNN